MTYLTLTLYHLFLKRKQTTTLNPTAYDQKYNGINIYTESASQTYVSSYVLHLISCFVNTKCNSGSIVMFPLQQELWKVLISYHSLCTVFNQIFQTKMGDRNVGHLNVCEVCLFCSFECLSLFFHVIWHNAAEYRRSVSSFSLEIGWRETFLQLQSYKQDSVTLECVFWAWFVFKGSWVVNTMTNQSEMLTNKVYVKVWITLRLLHF